MKKRKLTEDEKLANEWAAMAGGNYFPKVVDRNIGVIRELNQDEIDSLLNFDEKELPKEHPYDTYTNELIRLCPLFYNMLNKILKEEKLKYKNIGKSLLYLTEYEQATDAYKLSKRKK